MIGSPASRCATASRGWRGCFAAIAPVVNAVSATAAANITIPGGPQRRIVPLDCAVVSRSFMPYPGCLSALASIIGQIAIFGLRNRSHHPFRIRRYSVRSGDKSLIYDGSRGRKGDPGLKLVAEAGPGLAGGRGRMSAFGGGA